MRLYADLRSFQDRNFAFRGIGRVGSALLRHVRKTLPSLREIVGLVDEQMPALPPAYRDLVDGLQHSFCVQTGGPTLFFQPSPMTHDPARLAVLLRRPGLFCATLVYDFIPLDEPGYLSD